MLVAVEDHDDPVKFPGVEATLPVAVLEDGQGVIQYLLRLGPELAVKHLNMRRCQPVGTLNLTQILRFGLLAFADDQQPLIGLPHGRTPLQVSRGLPVFGLVVLPHRFNAPQPWLAQANR